MVDHVPNEATFAAFRAANVCKYTCTGVAAVVAVFQAWHFLSDRLEK